MECTLPSAPGGVSRGHTFPPFIPSLAPLPSSVSRTKGYRLADGAPHGLQHNSVRRLLPLQQLERRVHKRAQACMAGHAHLDQIRSDQIGGTHGGGPAGRRRAWPSAFAGRVTRTQSLPPTNLIGISPGGGATACLQHVSSYTPSSRLTPTNPTTSLHDSTPCTVANSSELSLQVGHNPKNCRSSHSCSIQTSRTGSASAGS
jgi:hypothetical protein